MKQRMGTSLSTDSCAVNSPSLLKPDKLESGKCSERGIRKDTVAIGWGDGVKAPVQVWMRLESRTAKNMALGPVHLEEAAPR